MYNRYIPRSDGSYSRNRRPDKSPQNTPPPPPPQPEPNDTQSYKQHREQQEKKVSSDFLKQLLPKGFDIGDLIVILLLLLMAGDSQEDKNNAILTLALYFLM